jgi:hypothetical protein
MRTTTVTFQGYKGEASYACTCGGCGKTLKRKIVVEHTSNPFNGFKSPSECHRSATEEARAQAAKLEGAVVTCKTCEEAPMKALLLAMAAEPARFFKVEGRYWNSPMHHLVDRKHAIETFEFKDGNPHNYAPENYISQGYRITGLGLARALKFKPEPVAA